MRMLRNRAILVMFLILLAGCDALLSLEGTVVSSTGANLRDCSIRYLSRSSERIHAFDPPTFRVDDAVSPFGSGYDVIVECADHVPAMLKATTRKGGGRLGKIVLDPYPDPRSPQAKGKNT